MKPSIMEKDIGKHQHEVDIFDSYETYAVCRLCQMHDWSTPSADCSNEELIKYFKTKYPQNHKVIDFDEV